MELWVFLLALCLILLALPFILRMRERFAGESHKQDVLGPTGKSEETVVGPDSYTTNKYPQLLGGEGSLSTRMEGAGITSPSKNWLLVADGSLPSSASLGSDENSKYLPFSRVATTLEPAPDPSKISQSFGDMSVKTEPSPFLTDFSAFFR